MIPWEKIYFLAFAMSSVTILLEFHNLLVLFQENSK